MSFVGIVEAAGVRGGWFREKNEDEIRDEYAGANDHGAGKDANASTDANNVERDAIAVEGAVGQREFEDR